MSQSPQDQLRDPTSDRNRAVVNRTVRYKLALAIALAVVVGGLYYLFGDRLSVDELAEREATLRQYQQDHPVRVFVLAFLTYVLVTGLSVPGAALMSLFMGWYFRFAQGFILVSFAAAGGATVAFLLSRYFLREPIQRRFGDRLNAFNEALDREGAFYLFTLRLVPVVPFFVINVVMGLTRIRTLTFWWVSQLGMLAGTCVFVYAGSTLPSLAQLADASQLRPTDVRNWPRLLAELAAVEREPAAEAQRSGGAGGSSAAGPAKRIWEALPAEVQAQLSTSTAAANTELQQQILRTANRLLQQPDFSLATDWQQVLRPPVAVDSESPQRKKQRREAEKRLTEVNRELLVAAWPDLVSPPQPILSKQLFAAFAVLGVFPILVKKIMGRVNRRGVVS